MRRNGRGSDKMDLGFLKWIDHAGFVLDIGGKRVYIDPFQVKDPRPADVIFVTHSHFDHLSMEDIRRLETPKTQFVAPKETARKLEGRSVLAVEPGGEYGVEGIKFSTVAAYNVKPDRLMFHPRSNGWVGYVIDAGGTRVYHAGDTDLTDEMRRVETDLALLPMGGTYTMGVDEAIEAANSIKAQKAAPMHYRSHFGRKGYREAEEKFLKGVKNGIILEQLQEPSFRD
jgi:L-ascorbate metabolism protein UlaG (beta-lactamase superfamily)